MIERVPPAPTRRTVLGLLLVPAGAATLTGCGVRLEDDAPDVPLVPRRQPLPGEAAMLTVLGTLAGGSGPHDAARRDALHDALADAKVPARDMDAVLTTTPVGRAEQVTAYEAALGECPASLLPLMGSLLVGRMLDGDLPERYWTAPGEPTWSAPDVAGEALAATRAADYAMTIVAAKGGERLARRTAATRLALAGLVTRQRTAADDDGTSTALGYELEEPVRTAAEATRLARRSLGRLVDAYVALLPDLAGDRAAAREVTRWTATVQRRARQWGVEDPELPGMRA